MEMVKKIAISVIASFLMLLDNLWRVGIHLLLTWVGYKAWNMDEWYWNGLGLLLMANAFAVVYYVMAVVLSLVVGVISIMSKD